jgi:hypothetical protein
MTRIVVVAKKGRGKMKNLSRMCMVILLTVAGCYDASDNQSSLDENDIPMARWVMWDKDENPVDSIIWSLWNDQPNRFGEINPSCIYLSYIGDTRIGMYFDLKTGRSENCEYSPVVNYDSWAENSSTTFLDPSCLGDPYYPYHQHGTKQGSAYPSAVTRVQGVFYFVENEPDIIDPKYYYRWNSTTKKCMEIANSDGLDFWTFKTVPDWVLDILSDAPYSITLEY